MNELEKERYEREMEKIPTFDDKLIKNIQCSNCNRRLLDIIKNDRIISSKTTVLKIMCPFCGDSSFEQTIKGEFYLGNTDSVEYTEIDMFNASHLDTSFKALVHTRKVS